MNDIQIITSVRLGKAVISGLTNRGIDWIFTQMTEDAPITVDIEAIADIEKLIIADGLTVIVR